MTYSRDKFTAEVFEDLIYTYIESGFPVFAMLKGHVVVALGHHSDYAKAVPADSTWIKSSFFNDAFVINDDNFYPYQRIERQASQHALISKYILGDILAFAVPLPEKVFLSAEAFSSLVKTLVTNSQFGVAQHSPTLRDRPLLVRQFLTTSKSFKQHIQARKMGHPTVAEVYHNLPLPHFIWVCELSTPEYYVAGNQRVLGEVIWDATRNPHEKAGFISVHYPENLWVDVGSAFNQLQSFKEWPIAESDAYPVLRSNLLEI
jgi:hypothetical protein